MVRCPSPTPTGLAVGLGPKKLPYDNRCRFAPGMVPPLLTHSAVIYIGLFVTPSRVIIPQTPELVNRTLSYFREHSIVFQYTVK